ncbi:hypothetical protein FHX42_003029 [Saccharopolyspora lacisalsi]|uniref:Uncharacterized protein n=1 Tax=Halosaccharopolyspora lacisalsi TaxID=1000566 RepID=A0A839DX95_9PSEU|nr:hypothetical protein [Halosaccharopolyspora lacisalsi]
MGRYTEAGNDSGPSRRGGSACRGGTHSALGAIAPESCARGSLPARRGGAPRRADLVEQGFRGSRETFGAAPSRGAAEWGWLAAAAVFSFLLVLLVGLVGTRPGVDPSPAAPPPGAVVPW